jgi:uncharacterized protein (DUF302 family)
MTAITKNRFVWGLLGFVAGVWVTNIGVVLTIRNSVVREYRSPHDLSTTVQAISTNAASRGWTVSEPAMLQKTPAPGPDQPAVPVRIIQLSHPDYTYSFIEHGRNRCVAMAPATLVLYERGGQVYVSWVNNPLIGRFFRIEAREPFDRLRADEREIMGFLAKR